MFFKLFAIVLVVRLVENSSLVQTQNRGDEVCETLPSDIHLIKGIRRDFFLGKHKK